MLKRRDIKFIKTVDDASSVFGNIIDLKGGINYFLKDTNYNDELIDLSKRDYLISSEFRFIN